MTICCSCFIGTSFCAIVYPITPQKSYLITEHLQPSPIAAKIVSNILLPLYGWRHKKAGKGYPETEKSFRSTTSATTFTNRGFVIVVDRQQQKVRFVFDASKADTSDRIIRDWLATVERRVGLGPITPEPFWGFENLKYAIGSKILNCFYVIADRKIERGHEYFKYENLFILSGFSFEGFMDAIESGFVLVDFDARTGHNHGTKFRLKQGFWPKLYSNVIQAL
jgi:hypothetical protein